MTTATRLNTSSRVTLDANGYGLIRLAPAGEKWEVDRVRVECSTRVSEAKCIWYVGHVGSQYQVDGTWSGSSGATSDTKVYLEDGEAMFLEWSGGDPGATAIVTVSGWRSNPDGGFRAVH